MKNQLIYLLLFVAITSARCQSDEGASQPAKTDESWLLNEAEKDSLEQVGIDPEPIQNMVKAITKEEYPNIHSVLIAKGGKFAFERYFRGKDQIWGSNIGNVNHSGTSLHDVRSISKSVVSACIGIAMAQGKIESVSQKVFDFFPEHSNYNTGQKSALTLEHMLTMTDGLEWNETFRMTIRRTAKFR